jgi:hypothetical protein
VTIQTVTSVLVSRRSSGISFQSPTGDHRGVDAGLRAQPRRDGERHGQRQRDEADGHASGDVGDGGLAIVGRESSQQLRPGAHRPVLLHGIEYSNITICDEQIRRNHDFVLVFVSRR